MNAILKGFGASDEVTLLKITDKDTGEVTTFEKVEAGYIMYFGDKKIALLRQTGPETFVAEPVEGGVGPESGDWDCFNKCINECGSNLGCHKACSKKCGFE